MLSTKWYSCNLKVESYFIWWECLGLLWAQGGGSISVALRKLLQGGGKESQAVYTFATTDQAIWTLKIKYQVKEFSILCMGRCKPLGSLNSFLSYAPQLLLLLLSRFSRVRLCATPQTAAHQAPPSLGFSRQEHWSGLPFPSPMHERESEVAQTCPTLCDPMD